MTRIPQKNPLTCPDCGELMHLKEKPAHWSGTVRYAYICSRFPKCRGVMSAHPNGAPVGIPADAETRNARKLTHFAFDPLWKTISKGRDDNRWRERAYMYVAEKLGTDRERCHIGLLSIEACRAFYAVVNETQPWMIIKWWREKNGHAHRPAKKYKPRQNSSGPLVTVSFRGQRETHRHGRSGRRHAR